MQKILHAARTLQPDPSPLLSLSFFLWEPMGGTSAVCFRECVCELKISLCCKLTPQTPLSDCALCVCVCVPCVLVCVHIN